MMLFDRTILAIDDDADDIQLLQEALAEHSADAQLIAVQNAEAFFHSLFTAQTKAADWTIATPVLLPDLILLDVNMPKLTGLEVLRLIRQNPQLDGCKVAMLTTSVNPSDKQACFDAGADLYLVKPSSFAQLVELCDTLLHQVLPIPRSAVLEVFNARQ